MFLLSYLVMVITDTFQLQNKEAVVADYLHVKHAVSKKLMEPSVQLLQAWFKLLYMRRLRLKRFEFVLEFYIKLHKFKVQRRNYHRQYQESFRKEVQTAKILII